MQKQTLVGLPHGILAGHRAVVTGASGGIGEEYARQLASLGAHLVIAARRLDRLEKLAQELRSKYSVEVLCIQIDLAQSRAAYSLFEQATAQGKEVSILINNAGIAKYGSFLDFSLADHLSTIQINSSVPTETTYLFAQHMLKHGKPSYIAQIASIASFQPATFFSVYAGSKSYLLYFAEALAVELKDTNIKITCVCPGGTYTGFFEHSGQKITSHGHRTMMTSEDVVSSSIKAMLKGKIIHVPGILNKLACFLPRFFPRSFAIQTTARIMNKAVERVTHTPPSPPSSSSST